MISRGIQHFRVGDLAPCLVGRKIGERCRALLEARIRESGPRQTWFLVVTGQITDYTFYNALLAPLLDSRNQWPEGDVLVISGKMEVDVPDLLLGLGWDRGEPQPTSPDQLESSLSQKGRHVTLVEEPSSLRYLGVTGGRALELLRYFETTAISEAPTITKTLVGWSTEDTVTELTRLEKQGFVSRLDPDDRSAEPRFSGIPGLLGMALNRGEVM